VGVERKERLRIPVQDAYIRVMGDALGEGGSIL